MDPLGPLWVQVAIRFFILRFEDTNLLLVKDRKEHHYMCWQPSYCERYVCRDGHQEQGLNLVFVPPINLGIGLIPVSGWEMYITK